MLRVDYAQALPNVDRRDDGTLRVAANLTRTGILTYRKPDGSAWKEYRPATEVFHKDSLASYGGRPLTIGHRLDAVSASAWKDVAVGDVRDDAQADGQFVRATVQVSDADTIKRIDSGDLVEVSCGYRCDLENTPGEYQGEHYDAIQRNIRLNHVALLPVNAGRAGRQVRLLLDSDGNAYEEIQESAKIRDMTDELNAHKERADALEREAKAKAEAEALKGELAANKAALEKLRADMSDKDAKRGAEIAARVGLIDTAKKYLPELRVDTVDSDDAIKRAVIAKINPALRCDDNAAPAYVDGVFRSLVQQNSQASASRAAIEAQINGLGNGPGKNKPAEARADEAGESQDLLGDAKARCHAFGRMAWTLTEKEVAKIARNSRRSQFGGKSDLKKLGI